jgi:hypothetical protein
MQLQDSYAVGLLVASVCSVIGSCATIVSCTLKKNRSSALLINLMLTCLLDAASSAVRAVDWLQHDDSVNTICKIEAMGFYIAEGAGILWSCSMARLLYLVVTSGEVREDAPQWFWCLFGFNWGLPVAAAVFLLAADVLGRDTLLGHGCYVSVPAGCTLSNLNSPSCIISSFGILAMAVLRITGVCALTYVMIRVPLTLHCIVNEIASSDVDQPGLIESHRRRAGEVHARLSLHLLVFLVCWAPYTVIDLLELAGRVQPPPEWLLATALLAGSSSGALNALAYGGWSTANAFKLLGSKCARAARRALRRLCGRRNTQHAQALLGAAADGTSGRSHSLSTLGSGGGSGYW